MKAVISNTSPLTNLAAIGEMGLLERLFGRLHIAEAVRLELEAGGPDWPGRAEVAAASWVACHNVRNRSLVLALSQDLDPGESETIALGLEIGASLILMDEREGRHRAQRMGLRTMGVVGVLLRAKELGFLTTVRPSLDARRSRAGFWLGEAVYQQALSAASEVGGDPGGAAPPGQARQHLAARGAALRNRRGGFWNMTQRCWLTPGGSPAVSRCYGN
jgi:predicted nucleic acid-binding protein